MTDYKVFSRTEKSGESTHKKNEDRYLVQEICFMNDEKLKLLIVADGIGGLSAGEKASYHAVTGFSESVYKELLKLYMENPMDNFSITYYAGKLEKALREAIKEANRMVCEEAEPFKETGTTLSVVAILGDYAVAANVGDSPVYYYRSMTEEFSLVSKLHTKAESDVAAGLYERRSEAYYENDHIIYKSLGDKEKLADNDIFMKVIGYIQPGDVFLVGTDGAFGRMEESEIFEIISNPKENTVLKELLYRAREDKEDDQTAILFKVNGGDIL